MYLKKLSNFLEGSTVKKYIKFEKNENLFQFFLNVYLTENFREKGCNILEMLYQSQTFSILEYPKKIPNYLIFQPCWWKID